MKKIIIGLFILISLLFNGISEVFGYGEFYGAPINIKFINYSDGTPLSNYEIKLRTAQSNSSRFVGYTNGDGVLDINLDTPLELDRSKGEYSFSLLIGLSRLTIYNHKLYSGIKIYYSKEEGYIKKIEGIENKQDYKVSFGEKGVQHSPFPSGAGFWVTGGIAILVFFTTYNLIMSNDQKFLRLRNSTFEQEEIKDVQG